MYKSAKRQKKTKTKGSGSFTIRGSWEGILGVPTVKGKGGRESRQRVDWRSREKNKRNGRYNIGTDGVSVVLFVCDEVDFRGWVPNERPR